MYSSASSCILSVVASSNLIRLFTRTFQNLQGAHDWPDVLATPWQRKHMLQLRHGFGDVGPFSGQVISQRRRLNAPVCLQLGHPCQRGVVEPLYFGTYSTSKCEQAPLLSGQRFLFARDSCFPFRPATTASGA